MPPAPEILHGIRLIRPLEIHQQIKAQQSGNSSPHIRIACEIAVNLKSVKRRRQNDFHAAEGPKLTVHRINRNGNAIRNQQLFAQTPEQ